MKRRALPKIVSALIVVAAILFLFRRYFDQNGLLFGDSNFQWDRSLLDAALAQLGHSWAPAFGGGRSAIIANYTTSPLTLLQEVVSFAGIPLSTVLVYPLILIVAYAGCWTAARKISQNALSAHAVSIFFVGNPWIWDRVLLGHVAILASVAVTPWILATIVYRDRLRYAFAPIVFAESAIMLAFDSRTSYMVFIGLVIVAIWWIVSSIRYRKVEGAVQGIALLVSPFVALALNAWWSLPFLQLAGINPVRPFFPPLEDVLSYSRYSDFAHNVVLSGSFLHFSWDRTAANGPWSFIPWYVAMLVVMVSAFFTWTKSRALNVILHVGILASLLASMGTALVPPGAAMWMYAHVPMSEFFRDPNKLALIAILCIVPLLSIRLGTASLRWRIVITAAIVVAVLPTFSGDLRTTDGTGLQPFTERGNFVDVLDYLTAQPGFPNFRVALVPPWTAEVALQPGQHPVADPFVFQYKVPTMDAKLINVASDMNMSAWRVFENLYAGTDTHPGSSLAVLGVKYLVWDDAAALDAGAENTPFFNVAGTVVQHALDTAGFTEVYRSGSLHVLENPAFTPLVRGIVGPVVDGVIPEHIRAVLPASAIGDSVEAVDGHRDGWPFPTIGVGSSARDACLSRTPRSALLLAYDHVTAHADWTSYWVDSDYLQQGTGDAMLGRLLADYPLPYAFTQSSAVIPFTIDVPAGARLAVEGALLSAGGRAEYAIDAGAWKPLALPSGMLGWDELERVTAGRHRVTIRGSSVGTVLRALAAIAPKRCGGTYLTERPLPAIASGGSNWIVPSPLSALTLTERGGKFSFAASNVSLNARGVSRQLDASAPIDGPGADGILVDHLTTPIGIPFNVLLGYHHVEFFAKGAPVAASPWAHLLNGNATGEAGTQRFRFTPRYSEEGAFTTLSGLAPGSTVLLRLPYRGTAARAHVRIYQGGAILARYDLSAGASFVTMPAYGDSIQVAVRREGGSAPLELEPPQAFSGVALGDSVLDLPDRAARAPLGRLAYAQHGAVVKTLRLFSDNRALVANASSGAYTVIRGAQGLLTYAGLNSSAKTRCSLAITYETAGGSVVRPVADVDLGNGDARGSVPVPILPRSAALLPRFSCDDEHAILSLASASITFTSSPQMGMLIGIPRNAGRTAEPATISSNSVSSEELRVAGQPVDVVWLSSFDPAWQFGSNEHFLVNGSENGWLDSRGDRIVYAVQQHYRNDISLSLWLWALLVASIAATLLLNRYRR